MTATLNLDEYQNLLAKRIVQKDMDELRARCEQIIGILHLDGQHVEISEDTNLSDLLNQLEIIARYERKLGLIPDHQYYQVFPREMPGAVLSGKLQTYTDHPFLGFPDIEINNGNT